MENDLVHGALMAWQVVQQLARASTPHLDDAVRRAASDVLLVGGPRALQQVLLVAVLDPLELLLAAILLVEDEWTHVPLEQMAVHAVGEQVVAIGAERESRDCIAVASQFQRLLDITFRATQVPTTVPLN